MIFLTLTGDALCEGLWSESDMERSIKFPAYKNGDAESQQSPGCSRVSIRPPLPH